MGFVNFCRAGAGAPNGGDMTKGIPTRRRGKLTRKTVTYADIPAATQYFDVYLELRGDVAMIRYSKKTWVPEPRPLPLERGTVLAIVITMTIGIVTILAFFG
jgi:hypothetical protein